MSGKLASLKTALGGNIAESMGKGSTVPVQAPALGVPASQVGVQRLKSGAFSIQLDRIIPDPGQPRKDFDDAELKRLAASLLMHGQLQPIRVRWDEGQGRYLVIAGERRWRAASALKWDSIQCVVADPATGERGTRIAQLVENCLRVDLSRMERAKAFRALMDAKGISAVELSEELSISESTISKDLALLDLPEPVREKVEQGAVSPSVAYEIRALPEAVQVELAGKAERGELTRDEAATESRRLLGGKPRGQGSRTERFVPQPGVQITVTVSPGVECDVAEALRLAAAQAKKEKRRAAG